MNNKEYIRGAFDEIHAPDALTRKVKNMNKKEAKRNFNLRYAAAGIAAFAFFFMTSNGICYAATGETWVGKAIVYINGEKQETNIEWKQEGDTLVGEVSYEIEEGDSIEIVEAENADGSPVVEDVELAITDDGTSGSDISGTANITYSSTIQGELSVVEESEKMYLVSGSSKIDITEDFADGEATGTIELDGETMNYTVTGTPEEYEITFN